MVVQRTFQVRQTQKSLQFKALDGVIRVVNEVGEKVSLSHKCGELDQHIPDMLGVSKAIIENVIFCHQEDANWPLREGAELKKRFDQIFESARYTKALEAIRKLKKARLDQTKDYKRDLDVLTVNMKTAETIRVSLDARQEQLQQARREEGAGREEIASAGKMLEELQVLQTEVKRVHEQLKRREEDVVLKEQSVWRAYSKIENIMSDTDDELQGVLNDYETIIEDHRRALIRLQEVDATLQTERSRANEEYVVLRAAKARVETNIDAYRKKVADVIDLASRLSTKYCFHLQPLSSQQDDVSTFLAEFRNIVQKKQDTVNSLDAKQRQDDEKLTTELSELTSQVKHVRNELEAKMRCLEALNRDKKAIASRLSELGRTGFHSQREAEEMSTQVLEAEQTLADVKKKHNIAALKHEIQDFNRQINDINGVVEDLGQQITTLRTYAHKNSELEVKRSEYKRRQEAFEADLNEKVLDIEEILEGGEPPTDRASLVSTIARIDDLIAERQHSCDMKKKELRSAEQRLVENETSSKLAEKELNLLRAKKNELEMQQMPGLKALLDKVIPGRDLASAELGMKEAERIYADAKDKVVRRKNMVMFLKIYKNKGMKDHACPLCERGMNPEEERVYESILNDKTDDRKVADKIKKAEELETSSSETLNGMKERMPSWRKWMELETTIPQKVNELEAIYASQKMLEYDVQDKTTSYDQALEQLEGVKTAKSEMEILRKCADDLHSSDASITKEEQRMRALTAGSHGPDGRSLFEVEAEKDSKQAEAQALNLQLQRKQKEVDRINEMLQQLQNDLHSRREEKLKKETQRKEYDEAVKEQNRLREQEKILKEAILKLKKLEPELERDVCSKTTERETRRAEAREQLRAKRFEFQEGQGDFRVFSNIAKQVQSGELDKLEREVQSLSERIAQTKQKEEAANQSRADLAPRMKSAEKILGENEIVKRHIQDNLDYRALQKELENMRAEVQLLRVEVENLPPLDDVNDRVAAASATLQAAQVSCATLTGKKQQLMENIREDKIKLRAPNLKNIEEKYRHKLIQFETTQMAVADLDRYFKALDESLLQYHSKKVEEINTIIRTLWQITYKGQDIDTIELVSGQQEGMVSKAARSYDYRVVMKKAGTAIEMRGRCSAGQKVLAALVIRLALAETFCLNCGILALDEPTTNLDTENKFGLAQAITEYVRQ
uniref:Rad50/SbcC-type AAA domain-containing protein n=1 Tax=Hyaloperonospora arabidopsidis (strain Emoy2) TaxID=559515 RepID=M4BIK8_HYAAE